MQDVHILCKTPSKKFKISWITYFLKLFYTSTQSGLFILKNILNNLTHENQICVCFYDV